MADEERQDENAEQQPGDAPPEEQPIAAEEPAAEETAAEEQPAEVPPESDEPEAAEAPAAEPPPASEEPASSEAPAEKPAAARDAAEAEKPKADVVPGAELEPIALEPERPLSAEERARLEAEEEERRKREAEVDSGSDEPVARRGPKVEIPADALIQATGKRKSSIARVILRPGDGAVRVNDRSLEEYFPRQNLRTIVRQPLLAAGYDDAVEVRVRVHGGGISGQAGAVRHGIARALTEVDPELRPELKRRGLLTRDARAKERRKAGLKKARKRPQFSKR